MTMSRMSDTMVRPKTSHTPLWCAFICAIVFSNILLSFLWQNILFNALVMRTAPNELGCPYSAALYSLSPTFLLPEKLIGK